MKKYLWFLLMLIIVGLAALGPIMSRVEQPQYVVIQNSGAIQIRDYKPMVVAEVEVSGEREVAIKKGFRLIADYIFGDNISSQKVAMTAPVTQQASEKIAMTVPVTQQSDHSGSWKVRFMMPSTYTLATLPRPKNAAVKLKVLPAKRYAVIRFTGIASPKKLHAEKTQLLAFIAEQNLKSSAPATYAFFNPPWTLPFLRRNEVMIEIAK